MILSHDHDPIACHKANNDRQKIINNLKELVNSLNDCCDRTGNSFGGGTQPPEWTRPLITYPLTKERKASYDKIERIPPWEKKRKSIQIMGGAVVKGCSCLKRNGLQADCQMSGCKGHPLCLTKPYPMCPPSGRADVMVTPQEAEEMLRQLGPPTAPFDPNQCTPGRGCRPDCVPCSSTVNNICQWMPDWMNEEKQKGGGNGGGALRKEISGGGGGQQQQYTSTPSSNPSMSKIREVSCEPTWWCCVANNVYK